MRRVNGRELNDEEMIWHYATAQQHGDSRRRYSTIWFDLDADNCFSSIDLRFGPSRLLVSPHHGAGEYLPDSLGPRRLPAQGITMI